MNNFFLIVIDGVGVGELPDAINYNDVGSNTLQNIASSVGGLQLPNLEKLGLGNIIDINGIQKTDFPLASFGKMNELSKGKDSTTGHWELGGIEVKTEFSYFPDGFPDELIENFIQKTGVKGVLGNKAASGTEIIKELGEEHLKTGFPIVYTSADSVFQIAAHERYFGLNRLLEICKITREEILVPPLQVGRVIARPFIGKPGTFERTTNRKDFSLKPPSETILDVLQNNGVNTISIGKISDLFNYCGINQIEITKSNEEGQERLLAISESVSNSFVFTNLVDFDVYFGHRNDASGFATALVNFDKFLEGFINKLDDSDQLIITSDHGNDPTTPSTDHSREYVPLLYYQQNKLGINLGTRKTFSDVAKTISDFFGIENNLKGTSFFNGKN